MSAITQPGYLMERRRRSKASLSLVFGIVLQIAASLYAYGRLTERVDDMREQIQEIRQILLQKSLGGNK